MEGVLAVGMTFILLSKYPITVEFFSNMTKGSVVVPVVTDVSNVLIPLLPKSLTEMPNIPGLTQPASGYGYGTYGYGYGYNNMIDLSGIENAEGLLDLLK